MNKKIKLMQLFAIALVLWNVQSNSMPNPYGQPQYGETQYTNQPMIYPQPGGYGMSSYTATQYHIPQPKLTLKTSTNPHKRQQHIPAVSSYILTTIQAYKANLWNIYQNAERINGQFNTTDWNQIVNDIMQIQILANSQTENKALQAAANELADLLKSTNIYLIDKVVACLNKLSEIHNNILQSNPSLYSNVYQTTSENLITPEDMINLPTTSIPLVVRGQQAVTGSLYEWTKPVIQPLATAAQTGWEYAKSLGSNIASGTRSVMDVAFPTEEKIKNLQEEIVRKKEELKIKKAAPNLNSAEIKQLKQEIIDKEYLLGSLTGWTPWLAKAALAGAAIGAYKSGAIGATTSGLYHGGSAVVKGGAQLGASAVKGTYKYATGSGE